LTVKQNDIDRRVLVGGAADIEDLEGLPARSCGEDIGIARGQERPFGEITGVFRIVDHK